MKKSELITLIKQIVRDINKEKELLYDDEEPIEEISTSGAAGAYDTPNAFSKTGNIDGKKFEKDGMTLAKHTEVWSKSADQIQKAEKKARKNSPIKIKEDIDPPDNEIKNGDKVYWNIMVGYYPRRISGVVQSIKNGIATVKQTTQNTDGKFTLKAVNKLIKSKDQERYQNEDIKNKIKDIIKEIKDGLPNGKKKKEKRNEIANRISKEVGVNKIKGGDLKDYNVFSELNTILKKFKLVADKYKISDSSVPSAPNSMTFRASRSGTPVSYDFNNVHRGGYYEGSHPYLVQVKIGGGIDSDIYDSLLDVARSILSKFTYTSDFGKEHLRDSSGTNWSSWMIESPSKGDTYNIIPKYFIENN